MTAACEVCGTQFTTNPTFGSVCYDCRNGDTEPREEQDE